MLSFGCRAPPRGRHRTGRSAPSRHQFAGLDLGHAAVGVDQLPKDSGPNALADDVLREAEGQLPMTLEGTVRCIQNRARLVRALYERFGPAGVRELVVRWSGEEFVVTGPGARP
ncbi:hypothetical protein [Streptomyces sp. NPDC058240]|uniref:hypothetical protein n=1 Tax=Streptomyces sp. NPDC058240 TaxID=3346396 RepID=UPI0036F140E2